MTPEEHKQYIRDIRAAEEAARVRCEKVLEEMAERQRHFATPGLYPQQTESETKMFRHAEEMLAEALRRIRYESP